ncbi:MAG TPA: hypothetical protein VFH69_10330 [Gemmatimonadota bacterium]|nr:hypothetical protein [Gemmatimonadota bacterium]
MTDGLPCGRVIVIAGPSCCGKSTFARSLMQGDMPLVAEALGLYPGSSCEFIVAKDWRRIEESTSDTVLLHYDFTRPPFREGRTNRDGALRTLSRARSLCFLTLWAPPAEVDRRFRRKIRRDVGGHLNSFQLRLAWRAFIEMRRRLPFVARMDLMWGLYVKWFEFASAFASSPHWIIRSDAPDPRPTLLPTTMTSPFWEVSVGSAT